MVTTRPPKTIVKPTAVPSIYSSARPELDRSPVSREPCLHDLVVCSRSALGTAANTDTKLLIYGLFKKGRVLAQDGVTETKTAPAASSRSTSFAKSERERVSRSTL